VIGQTLSHYRILEEIGRGGMGVVYQALDLKLNRKIALKVLPSDSEAGPERKARFIQEAQAAAALKHPNVAVIYEVDAADGVDFITMELVEGEKLSESISRGSLPAAWVVEVAVGVGRGLVAAHERHVIHRDLKPANVMVTKDGHPKIIDFGLAKLTASFGEAESEDDTAARLQTQSGMIVGTASYMSPEQARGGTVDHRTDIFSFGVLLFELLSGELPFRGSTAMDTLGAILRSEPAELEIPSGEISTSSQALNRIVTKCLAKDPNHRFQTMNEVLAELDGVRQRLGSRSRKPVGTWRVVAAMGIALGLGATGLVLLRSEAPVVEHATSTFSRPSVAVLYFENVRRDPSLDWLRSGLTDMMVTDLSQSPHVDVVSMDRLYQILAEGDYLDDEVASSDVVREVASKGEAGTVILGSFMKAGETIRINVRLQDASTGRILTTVTAQADGEDGIFPTVDELTRRVRDQFEMPTAADEDLDRRLEEVTTSSPEAYRYYAEGRNLMRQGKDAEAVFLFQRAVEVDAEFAMAHSRLSAAHANIGQVTEANAHAERAMALSERLPGRERYYIESRFYGRKGFLYSTKVQEVLREGLRHYPNDSSFIFNYAAGSSRLEDWDDSREGWETLVEQGTLHPGVYKFLAATHTTQGDVERGCRLLEDFQPRATDQAFAHSLVGRCHLWAGELDAALAAFDESDRVGVPGADFELEQAKYNLHIVREDWERVRAVSEGLKASREPYPQMLGWLGLSRLALNRGHRSDALDSLESAAAVLEPGRQTSYLRAYGAHLRLLFDAPVAALELAQKAQAEGKDGRGEREGLFYEGVTHARSGDLASAMSAADALREIADQVPGGAERRRYDHVTGEIDLARGDTASAVAALERAASTLPPRGLPGWNEGLDFVPQHVPVWYSLGHAYLAAGDDDSAAISFRRITESTTERIEWPLLYVRSFYLLGTTLERLDDDAGARVAFRRFIDLWGEGDIDRELVDEIERKLSESSAALIPAR